MKAAFRLLTTWVASLAVLMPAGCRAWEAGLDLPRPSGCYPTGTRTEVFRDLQRQRDLLVTLWYPAMNGKSAPAPYMDARTADAVAEEWKLQPNFQKLVRPHARLRAPLATGGPFPIVLLEHGSGVVPALYTALAEELASQGFIVVATNHPPDSLIAVFPDGHVLRFTPFWSVEADRHSQGVAIGKFAGEVLVGDVRFVLDQLIAMNSHSGFWRGHMNPSKIGIVGHSMGGTTAALATQQDSRILAGVNLDGSTYPGMNGDVRPVPVHKPFLFLATEEHASGETRAQEYIGSADNTYYVVVKGANHMSFSDGDLLSTRFGRERKADGSGVEKARQNIELTRSLVEEFLGKYLRDTTAPHLDGMPLIEKK